MSGTGVLCAFKVHLEPTTFIKKISGELIEREERIKRLEDEIAKLKKEKNWTLL